jgi:hypothetical protein
MRLSYNFEINNLILNKIKIRDLYYNLIRLFTGEK